MDIDAILHDACDDKCYCVRTGSECVHGSDHICMNQGRIAAVVDKHQAVKVTRSPHKDAGMELVAARRIEKGEIFAAYVGTPVRIKPGPHAKNRLKDVYQLEVNTGKERFVLTARARGSIARFANEALSAKEINATRECRCVEIRSNIIILEVTHHQVSATHSRGRTAWVEVFIATRVISAGECIRYRYYLGESKASVVPVRAHQTLV